MMKPRDEKLYLEKTNNPSEHSGDKSVSKTASESRVEKNDDFDNELANGGGLNYDYGNESAGYNGAAELRQLHRRGKTTHKKQ